MIDLQFNGLFGLIILIADIYAIVKTVQSNAETLTKVLWIVVILFLPLLGVILWYFFGPRG
jgi:Phospholipase_D-nuclease N-terminal